MYLKMCLPHIQCILNDGNSNITYSVVDDIPILIKVSGGNSSISNNDYYTFTDENDNPIQIYGGTFKFMRGRTYKFADYGISIDHPFKIYYSGSFSGTISGGSGGTGYIDIIFPQIILDSW